MAMETPPFEDVFPIEYGGFSIAMFVFGSIYVVWGVFWSAAVEFP